MLKHSVRVAGACKRRPTNVNKTSAGKYLLWILANIHDGFIDDYDVVA